MWKQLRNLKDIYQGAVFEWNEDKVPRMAAALAFYTVFSLAPVVIITVTVAGLVFGRDAALREVFRQAAMLIGPDGVAAIQLLVTHAPAHPASPLATIVGVATMIFAATGAFAELKDSLNSIWEVRPRPGLGLWAMARDRFLSFALILVMGFFMAVSLMMSATLSTLNDILAQYAPAESHLLAWGHQATSFLLFGLLFALIYKVLPEVHVPWHCVWLGAATTTVLSVIGKWLFGAYLGHTTIGAGYGAAGSLVIVVLWTYYSTLILLFGAELTQVQAKREGLRVMPTEKAVHISEHARVQEGMPHQEVVDAAIGQADADRSICDSRVFDARGEDPRL